MSNTENQCLRYQDLLLLYRVTFFAKISLINRGPIFSWKSLNIHVGPITPILYSGLKIATCAGMCAYFCFNMGQFWGWNRPSCPFPKAAVFCPFDTGQSIAGVCVVLETQINGWPVLIFPLIMLKWYLIKLWSVQGRMNQEPRDLCSNRNTPKGHHDQCFVLLFSN